MKLCIALVFALAVFSSPTIAAEPTPPEHTLHLSDADLQTIYWIVTTYGGEHCGVPDQQVIFCHGAIAGHELITKLKSQVDDEAKNKTKAKKR